MNIHKTYTGDKVPKLTKYLYPASTIFRDSAYTLVSMFFMTFIQFCAPLGYAWVQEGSVNSGIYTSQMLVISAIIIVLRIWDGFNDPIMGFIIEKCHFKSGKYKPWILIGGLSNAVVLFFMFYLRPVGWWYVIAFGIFYLLWDFTFTMNDIGYWSMLPSLSSDEKERNTLTTLVSVCASIGAFTAGGVIPMVASGHAVKAYWVVALAIAILFAASQIILYLFCEEHTRANEEFERKNEAKFSDMFKILKDNSQTRVATIAMLIYYTSSNIINGFGMNYFYFNYGYGTGTGGSVQFYFLIAYALGTIIAQVSFPFLLKKFKRSQLMTYCFIFVLVFYLIFFFYDLKIGNVVLGFRDPTVGVTPNMPDIITLCVIGVLMFLGDGLFYLILLILMTNTIEYNQYTTGERRESIIFALRPLTAKLASALMQGILSIGLISAGLYTISNSINNLEVQKALDDSVDVITQADASIKTINDNQLFIFKCFFVLIPLILFIVAYVLVKKKYFIDEKYYDNMMKEIHAKEDSKVEQK
jgi:sugar (glycoside-pentoside-hexuronide) transporter